MRDILDQNEGVKSVSTYYDMIRSTIKLNLVDTKSRIKKMKK